MKTVLLVCLAITGITACSPSLELLKEYDQETDLLNPTHRRYRSESIALHGNTNMVEERFAFNMPRVVDEEHEHIVQIKFKMPIDSLDGRTIDVGDSSMMVVCYRLSSWDLWSAKEPPVPVCAHCSGTIGIRNVQRDSFQVEHHMALGHDGLKLYGLRRVTR